jgi:hypothetical protein
MVNIEDTITDLAFELTFNRQQYFLVKNNTTYVQHQKKKVIHILWGGWFTIGVILNLFGFGCINRDKLLRK